MLSTHSHCFNLSSCLYIIISVLICFLPIIKVSSGKSTGLSPKSSPSSATATSSSHGSTSTIVEGSDVIITSETSDCPCSNSISQQFAIKRIGGKKGDPIVITKRAGSCCDHKDHSSGSSSSGSSSSSKLVPIPVPVPVPMFRPYYYHPHPHHPAPSQLIHHHMSPYASIPLHTSYSGSSYPGYIDHNHHHSSPVPMPLSPHQHHYPPPPHAHPPPMPMPPPMLTHASHHLLHPSSSSNQQSFWTSYENRPYYSDPAWSYDGSTLKSTLLGTGPTIQDKKSQIDYDYDDSFPTNLDLWD